MGLNRSPGIYRILHNDGSGNRLINRSNNRLLDGNHNRLIDWNGNRFINCYDNWLVDRDNWFLSNNNRLLCHGNGLINCYGNRLFNRNNRFLNHGIWFLNRNGNRLFDRRECHGNRLFFDNHVSRLTSRDMGLNRSLGIYRLFHNDGSGNWLINLYGNGLLDRYSWFLNYINRLLCHGNGLIGRNHSRFLNRNGNRFLDRRERNGNRLFFDNRVSRLTSRDMGLNRSLGIYRTLLNDRSSNRLLDQSNRLLDRSSNRLLDRGDNRLLDCYGNGLLDCYGNRLLDCYGNGLFNLYNRLLNRNGYRFLGKRECGGVRLFFNNHVSRLMSRDIWLNRSLRLDGTGRRPCQRRSYRFCRHIARGVGEDALSQTPDNGTKKPGICGHRSLESADRVFGRLSLALILSVQKLLRQHKRGEARNVWKGECRWERASRVKCHRGHHQISSFRTTKSSSSPSARASCSRASSASQTALCSSIFIRFFVARFRLARATAAASSRLFRSVSARVTLSAFSTPSSSMRATPSLARSICSRLTGLPMMATYILSRRSSLVASYSASSRFLAASDSSAAASACRAAVSSPVARSSRIVRILRRGWRA